MAVVLLGGFVPPQASAATAAREGAKCSKAGARARVSKKVTLVCTRTGTKTKVLKWKRLATVATIPTKPVVSTTVPVRSASSKIVIKDFAYVVATGIKKGEAVSSSNMDSVSHTVTHSVTSDQSGKDVPDVSGYSRGGLSNAVAVATVQFDVTVPANSSANLPLLGAGSYSFYCTIHPSMRGTLIVE